MTHEQLDRAIAALMAERQVIEERLYQLLDAKHAMLRSEVRNERGPTV